MYANVTILLLVVTATDPAAATPTGSAATTSKKTVSATAPSPAQGATTTSPVGSNASTTSKKTRPSPDRRRQTAEDDTTATLDFEINKLLKANIKGLSRTTVVWLVVLVVVAAIGAPIIGLAAGSSSSSPTPSILGVVLFATVMALGAFFLLRSRAAPLNEAAGVAAALQSRLTAIEQRENDQAGEVLRLEAALEDARRELASIPTLEATLLREREQLQAREKELTKARQEAAAVNHELTRARATAEERREELLRTKYNQTIVFAWQMMIAMGLAAGAYLFILWRRDRWRYLHYREEHDMARRYPEPAQNQTSITLKSRTCEVRLEGVEWKPEVVTHVLRLLVETDEKSTSG